MGLLTIYDFWELIFILGCVRGSLNFELNHNETGKLVLRLYSRILAILRLLAMLYILGQGGCFSIAIPTAFLAVLTARSFIYMSWLNCARQYSFSRCILIVANNSG